MFGLLSHRLLTLLQLTRMALVFTAISNAAAEVLLRASANTRSDPEQLLAALSPWTLAAMTAASVGLYGFGMSLNDIIDRRRDSRVAAHRPLPSGRIRPATAHVICAALALLGIWGGVAYAKWSPPHGRLSVTFLALTLALIGFYDFAGKYLVGLGLLSLGLIRFCQASIAAPTLPVVWHPLLLLNHVTILSAVCYHWEQKRPPLTPKHWAAALGGLAVFDVGLVRLLGWRLGDDTLRGVPAALRVNASLLPAAAAAVAFVGLAVVVRRRTANPRDAGQKLMLYGLLWLIVYDAAFVGGYASWPAAAGLVCLAPIAFGSVQLMRWWSRVIVAGQRPVFQRART